MELPHGNVDVPCLDLVHVLEQMDERTDGRIRISIPSKCKGKGKSTSPPRWLELETEGGSNYKELRLGKYATIANLMGPPPPHAVNVASAEIIEKFKYFKASAEGIKCQTG